MRKLGTIPWTVATCLCLFCAPGSLARAEDPPPVQNSPDESEPTIEPRRDSFSLRATDLQLEFDALYQYRRVKSSRDGRSDTTQSNRDWRFDQTASLSLQGHLVDPSVLRWDANLRLGFSQEDSRESLDHFTRDDRDSGSLLEYDIRLDFFPDRPVSGQAYVRKGRDRIPRRFLPSLLEERSEAGMSAFWSDGKWRGELSLDWSDLERTGNKANLDDESLETTRFTFDNRWEIDERQQLRIVFDHEREESTYQGSTGDFDTTRDQLRIEHDIDFGDKGQHHLSSYFRYSDEQGDLARDEIEAVTRLSLRHSDQWVTAYRLSAYQVDQDAVEITRYKGDFLATYKPDDRWRVTFDSFALREKETEDIETHQYGGGLDLSYRQPTSYGEFRGNFSFQADQLRTVGDAGEGTILGEIHELDSVRGAFLREPDVIRTSIRAYNAGRTRVYVEGRDYMVVAMGRVTSIYRILSGRILEGEPVSIDYKYRIPAGSRIDTYRTDLRLEHAFRNGITPYYVLEVRRQDASGSSAIPVFTDNTERHRVGTRLEKAIWSGGAELELFHDSVEPYDAFHTDFRVAILRCTDHEMDGTVRFSTYDFDGDRERRVHWFEVDATNRLRLSPYLQGTLKTAYRWEDNTRDGLTEGLDLECGLQYQRGALRVELIIEYDALDIDDNSDHGYGVWLNVRRDLTHLLARGEHR